MNVLGKKCALEAKRDLLHVLETKLRYLPDYSTEYVGTEKWIMKLQAQIRELERNQEMLEELPLADNEEVL